jgi:hypothetical protein
MPGATALTGGGQLEGGDLGEHRDAGLRRTVGSETSVTERGVDRRGVDDGPGDAVGDHIASGGLQAEEGSVEMNRGDATPALE